MIQEEQLSSVDSVLPVTTTDNITYESRDTLATPMLVQSSGLASGFKDLKTRRDQILCRLKAIISSKERIKSETCYTAATLKSTQLGNIDGKEEALAAATNELERHFNKKDFGRMKISKNDIGSVEDRIRVQLQRFDLCPEMVVYLYCCYLAMWHSRQRFSIGTLTVMEAYALTLTTGWSLFVNAKRLVVGDYGW
ncbi:hypothetical protein POM88_017252 [Heracleum sosnowskyi]|uniref:Uncharacterized protein n=1 Tax=Heracleum sosnowskyi TaxID=360622 RepID=A0AAD8MXU0_9APIA|nr:hypothetical protein POM88_017252 [Heracleum sosnowskyi]